MLCAYSEVFGFRGQSGKLSETSSPLHILAARAGIAPLGVAIDVGALVSMFACVLACTTDALCVLRRMIAVFDLRSNADSAHACVPICIGCMLSRSSRRIWCAANE